MLLAGGVALAAEPAKQAEPAPAAAPPLPVHTIEGYGGGSITPLAYLVNPGGKDEVFGLPSVSGTYVYIGENKNLEAFCVTETLFQRLELGFSASRFGLGDVKDDVEAAGFDLSRDDVYLYTMNARFLALPENSFDTKWLPAVTVGVHYKINDGIDDLDNDTSGAFTSLGLDNDQSVEFTLTATKMVQVFDMPLFLTAGVRNTDAAWMGYLGFADDRSFLFEGNAVLMVNKWLALGYEFRQQADPYKQIPGLVEEEDNLSTLAAIFMPTEHLNISLVWGFFGNVLNEEDNSVMAIQAKWEF
jgi:hypothetical protein